MRLPNCSPFRKILLNFWLETCHPEREWNSLSKRETTQPDFACAGYFFLIYLLFLFWIDPFLFAPYLGS